MPPPRSPCSSLFDEESRGSTYECPVSVIPDYSPTILFNFDQLRTVFQSLACPLCAHKTLQFSPIGSTGVRQTFKLQCQNFSNSYQGVDFCHKCNFETEFSNFDTNLDPNGALIASLKSSGVNFASFDRFCNLFKIGGFDIHGGPSCLQTDSSTLIKKNQELCQQIIKTSKEIEDKILKQIAQTHKSLEFSYDGTYCRFYFSYWLWSNYVQKTSCFFHDYQKNDQRNSFRRLRKSS